MANGVYTVRSVSFPNKGLLDDAVVRAKLLGVSFSKYVTLLIEQDLAENSGQLSVRDLVRMPAKEPIVRYATPQPTGSALNSEVPSYRVAGKPVTDPMPGVSPETADRARGGALAAQRLARKEARPKDTAASPTGSRSAPGPAVRRAKPRSPATPAPAQG